MRGKLLKTSLLAPSLVFAIASLISGLIHYGVQLYAARALSVPEFGEFSTWLSYLSLAQCVCIFVQVLSNFWETRGGRLRKALLLHLILALALLLPVMLDSSVAPSFDKQKLAAYAVVYGLSLGWLMGQLQIRLKFHSLSAIALILALSKVLILFSYSTNLAENIYFAFVYANFPAVIWAFFTLLSADEKSSPAPRSFAKKDLFFASVISFYYIMIPNVDLIIIDLTQSTATRNSFAPISLFYKIIFSLLVIVFQILLPYQIREQKERSSNAWFKRLQKINLYQTFLIMLSISIVSELLMPFMMKVLMPSQSALPFSWFFLSAMRVCLASYLYLLIQSSSAKKNLKPCLLPLVMHLMFCAMSLFLSAGIGSYLAFAILLDFWLIILLQGLWIPLTKSNLKRRLIQNTSS